MAVDSPPRNALAGWRQVPVQELVLPVVIVALFIAGVIIRPEVFPTSDNLLNVLTGLCVGISAVLLSGRLASASPVVGNLVELDAIAAVVIGGTALTGGKATVTGTFFGVITFALIFNLLNLLNMPAEIQGIVKGLLILAAVALQRRD